MKGGLFIWPSSIIQHRHRFISVDGMGVSDAQKTQNCPLGGNYGEENSGFKILLHICE